MDQNQLPGDSTPIAGSQFVNYRKNTQSPVSVSSTFGVPPRPKHQHRLLKSFSSLISVLVIVAISAYSVYAFMIPPEKVLNDALVAMKKDSNSKIDFSAHFSSDIEYVNGTDVKIVSEVEKKDQTDSKLQASIDIYNPNFAGAADVKLIDKILYFKIKEMPLSLLPYSKSIGTDWYSVSLDALKKNSLYTQPTLISGQNTLGEMKFISKPKFAGFAKISGGFARKYVVEINKDELIDFVTKSVENQNDGMGNLSLEYSKVVQRSIQDINFSPIYIYANLFSSTLKSVAFSIMARSNDGSAFSEANASDTSHISMLFQLNYDNSTAKTKIQTPQNVKVLDALLTGNVVKAKEKAKEAIITSLVLQVRNSLEVAYTDSYSGVCSKAMDINIQKEAIKSHGSALVCKDSNKGYVVYAKLPGTSSDSSTGYFCADSAGISTTLKSAPTGMVCK